MGDRVIAVLDVQADRLAVCHGTAGSRLRRTTFRSLISDEVACVEFPGSGSLLRSTTMRQVLADQQRQVVEQGLPEDERHPGARR